LLLRGAIAAEERVGLMCNVPRKNIEAIISLLPSIQSPTISQLDDPDWVAVNTVIEERISRELIPLLKEGGASGIVEYPLNKLIP